MSENKESNFRTLVIKNFRNIAPFCNGTKDDKNDDKEFLKINRSLNRDEMGGLVTIIGVNNSGKSNVLDAVEKYSTQRFDDDDYTDFTYAEKVTPSLSMNIANGTYGHNVDQAVNQRVMSKNTVTGKFSNVLFYTMMQNESMDLFFQFIGRQHKDIYGNVDYWINQMVGHCFNPAGGDRSLFEFILSNRPQLKMEDGTSFYDFFEDYVKRNSNNMYDEGGREIEKTDELTGVPIKVMDKEKDEVITVVAPGTSLEYSKNIAATRVMNGVSKGIIDPKKVSSKNRELAGELIVQYNETLQKIVGLENELRNTNRGGYVQRNGTLPPELEQKKLDIENLKIELANKWKQFNDIKWGSVSILDIELDESSKDLFFKRFGYHLSSRVFRYEREKIRQADLSCNPSKLSDFIKTLLPIIGFDPKFIDNAYESPGMKSKIEKNINKALVKVSDDFNDLLNVNEKKYSFEMRLEKDNIDFIIYYGDDVPLNLNRQSEGFRWLFEFYFNFLNRIDFQPGDMVVMDEFGNSLGFSTIEELIKKLRIFAKDKGITFIMATQNVMAVNALHLDEIRLVIPNDDGSSHIENNFDHFNENEDHDVLAPIISGLMVSRNFMRTENRRTVFVEGITDYFYLNSFSDILRSQGKEVDVDFVPIKGVGSSKESPSSILRQIMAIERNPTMLVDGDYAGNKFVSVAKNKNIHPSTISEIIEGKKVIEDLFSASDAERYEIKDKSFDKAACFSHKLPEIYDSLDNETKENFAKVIDYIMAQ